MKIHKIMIKVIKKRHPKVDQDPLAMWSPDPSGSVPIVCH